MRRLADRAIMLLFGLLLAISALWIGYLIGEACAEFVRWLGSTP